MLILRVIITLVNKKEAGTQILSSWRPPCWKQWDINSFCGPLSLLLSPCYPSIKAYRNRAAWSPPQSSPKISALPRCLRPIPFIRLLTSHTRFLIFGREYIRHLGALKCWADVRYYFYYWVGVFLQWLMSGNRKGPIAQSTSSTAHPKDELIKAYCEIIFLYTKMYRTNEESVFTLWDSCRKTHLQF